MTENKDGDDTKPMELYRISVGERLLGFIRAEDKDSAIAQSFKGNPGYPLEGFKAQTEAEFGDFVAWHMEKHEFPDFNLADSIEDLIEKMYRD